MQGVYKNIKKVLGRYKEENVSPFKNISRKVFKSFLCLNNMQYCNINIYTDTVEFFQCRQLQILFFLLNFNIVNKMLVYYILIMS